MVQFLFENLLKFHFICTDRNSPINKYSPYLVNGLWDPKPIEQFHNFNAIRNKLANKYGFQRDFSDGIACIKFRV